MPRLLRMDGLRGLLAVYVMLGHALPFTTLPGWATAPFSHGEAGVDLFFALSGLVLVNSLERFDYAFWPFMAARARRLLPVYYIVLAASIVLLMLGNPLTALPWVGTGGQHIWEAAPPAQLAWHITAHILLLQGIIPQGVLAYAYVTLLGPAWSLSTEWQFYALMGALAPRRLGWFALGLLALSAAYHLGPPALMGQFSRAFLPDAAAFFALGLASAAWLRGEGWVPFALCLAGAGALGLTQGTEKALVPLAWAFALAAQRQSWGKILECRFLQYLGAISYPLYLVNEPVGRALAMLIGPFAHDDPRLFTLLWLIPAILVSLGAASLLHHGVEARIMRTRKKNYPRVIVRPVQQ